MDWRRTALLLVSTATMGTIGYVSQDPVYIQVRHLRFSLSHTADSGTDDCMVGRRRVSLRRASFLSSRAV